MVKVVHFLGILPQFKNWKKLTSKRRLCAGICGPTSCHGEGRGSRAATEGWVVMEPRHGGIWEDGLVLASLLCSLLTKDMPEL